MPEVGHHGYAAAVAADRVVHPIMRAHVRNVIVRHAEVAAPAMGYTKGIELGPYLTHLPEQACSGPLLVQFPRGCSTSQDDARSIGRQPEIAQAAFGIGEHPSARTELAREIGGQGLR